MTPAAGDGPNPSAFARLAAGRRAWLAIDSDPRTILFVQGRRGAAALHLAFFAVLLLCPRVRPAIAAATMVVLSACARWPERRAWIIGASGIPFLFLRPFRKEELEAFPAAVLERTSGLDASGLTLQVALGVALFLLGAWALLEIQRLRRTSLVARRPLTVQIALFLGGVGLASSGLLGTFASVVLWSLVAVAASSFWFLAYALADGKARDPTPSPLRLGYLRTYWGGGTTPVGKGPAYLRKFEARDAAELAVTRLKALKLGVWAVLLCYVYTALERALHGWAELLTLGQALELQAAGTPPSVALCWASLIENYLLQLVDLAATGHILVSMVRMAGYRIPRNTVRPLAARTLTEFWNRYYFYFKELLVDLFFFPVFLRHFKRTPRLRLAFATLCAAGLGNWLYHVIRQVQLVPGLGFLGTLWCFRTYAVYCLVLASGLIVSQLRRPRAQESSGSFRSVLAARVNVALFFCLLGVLDDDVGRSELSGRLSFLLHLFGGA